MGRKGTETSLETRKLCISLYESGKTLKEISDIVQRSRFTVQYIIKRYKDSNSVQNKPRNINRKVLTDREERQILKETKKNPKLSAPKLATKLKEGTGKTVCAETIRRTLRKYGYNSRTARRKPFVSKVNQRKRVQFAKEHLTKDFSFWENVLFTDECKFNVFQSDGRQKVWRKVNKSLNKENLAPTVKYGGGSVMVWGCFSAAGVGNLVFIDGIMDAPKYINILKSNLQPSVVKLGIQSKFIFYQDNDPKHKALNSRTWLLYNCPKVLETPPQSADINPIENLWSHLKRKLQNHTISNAKQLRDILKIEWENIQPNETRKLVESMPLIKEKLDPLI